MFDEQRSYVLTFPYKAELLDHYVVVVLKYLFSK